MSSFLILYPTCRITKGIKRSVILDLEREIFFYIPNSMSDFIDYCREITYEDVLKTHNNSDIVISYKNFLLKEDLAFLEDKPNLFIPIPTTYEIPELLNNCVIDWECSNNYDIFHALSLLNNIGCKHVQIRFFNISSLEFLNKVLNFIQIKEFISVEIFYKYNDENIDDLSALLDLFSKIKILCVHGYMKTEIIKIDPKIQHSSNMGSFFVVEEPLKNSNQCGIIDPSYFVINKNTYLESLKLNTCLYKKIGIDTMGNIKNCPSILKSYGNINNVQDLSIILNDEDFKFLQNVNKDQISDCSVCEHRNICIDCRAFLPDNDIYRKPFKCSYDPYSGKWMSQI